MAIRNSDRVPLVCPVCETTFMKSSYQQITCSKVCSYTYQNRKKTRKINDKNCARCGKDMKHKKSHAIYCSMTCKSMDHTTKKRAKSNLTVVRRREIYERDSGICYICNSKIEFSKYQADHIIPISRGGEHTKENLAVTCSRCNQVKGTKIGIKQLEKLQELRIN